MWNHFFYRLTPSIISVFIVVGHPKHHYIFMYTLCWDAISVLCMGVDLCGFLSRLCVSSTPGTVHTVQH